MYWRIKQWPEMKDLPKTLHCRRIAKGLGQTPLSWSYVLRHVNISDSFPRNQKRISCALIQKRDIVPNKVCHHCFGLDSVVCTVQEALYFMSLLRCNGSSHWCNQVLLSNDLQCSESFRLLNDSIWNTVFKKILTWLGSAKVERVLFHGAANMLCFL